jgi:RNA polymerase-binding transcription factor DksA
MVTKPRTESSYDSAPNTEGYGGRREELDEARRFRIEQLVALERELAVTPYDSVTRALHLAAATSLAEIDAALDRMTRGVYGLCVTCARPIPEDRLDTLPMSAQCMPCHFNEQNCRFAGRNG